MRTIKNVYDQDGQNSKYIFKILNVMANFFDCTKCYESHPRGLTFENTPYFRSKYDLSRMQNRFNKQKITSNIQILMKQADGEASKIEHAAKHKDAIDVFGSRKRKK